MWRTVRVPHLLENGLHCLMKTFYLSSEFHLPFPIGNKNTLLLVICFYW